MSERYLEMLSGPIHLENHVTGERAKYAPTRFGEFQDLLRPDGRYQRRAGWRITYPGPVPQGLNLLLQWARKAGVLDGWFDRRWALAAPALKSMVMTNELPAFTPAGWNEWGQAERESWWSEAARGAWEEDQLDVIRHLRNAAVHPDFGTVLDPATVSRSVAVGSRFHLCDLGCVLAGRTTAVWASSKR